MMRMGSAFDHSPGHGREPFQGHTVRKSAPARADPGLLSLQRLAGNAAVVRLLASSRDTPAIPLLNVQRLIPELWNADNGQPTRKGRGYAQRASTNWGMNAHGLHVYITAFIRHLHEVAQLDTVVNSTTPCKTLFDHYHRAHKDYNQNWAWAVHDFVQDGRSRADVDALPLLDLPVNTANLNKIGAKAQLRWGKWFRYAPENFPPRHDPEINVRVAGATWGVIHLHYAPGTREKVWQQGPVGHLKAPQGGNERFQIGNDWLEKAHTLVVAEGGERPYLAN